MDHTTGPAYEVVGLEVLGSDNPIPINGITIENVTVDSWTGRSTCRWANVAASHNSPSFPKCMNTPPPPPPPPPHACSKATVEGCYNDTAGDLMPSYQPQLHDHVTFEACASACFSATMTLAGIDAGNHCFCGNATPASARARPVSECETMACHGDPSEKGCGGEHRLMVYNFTCRN